MKKSSFPSHLGSFLGIHLVRVLQAGSDSLAVAEICFLVISLLLRSSFNPPLGIFLLKRLSMCLCGIFCLFV